MVPGGREEKGERRQVLLLSGVVVMVRGGGF